MLKLVCFAAIVASACGQHQLYPGDPGYQEPSSYQANSYQQGPPPPRSYQDNSYQQGPAQYPVHQGQPIITATNYKTDDGQQRSETRSNDGEVVGQYSYVDPSGKSITVKYSAGKNGFQVEGDHLPQSPVAQGPESLGQYQAYLQAQNRGAHQFPPQPVAVPQTQYQQPHYQRQPQQYEPAPQPLPQQYQPAPQPLPQQYQPAPQQYQQPQQYQVRPQQYQQPQQYQPQPQQYRQPQQYQAQPQSQQYQTLANFPQQPQHRFGAAAPAAPQSAESGINVNVDPSGGFNYQFNYQ